MHGALRTYFQSGSVTASRQKAATSAREMEPASPEITCVVPVGGPSVRPPGRTTVYSRSDPSPPKKSASWLFLSWNTPLSTVHMSSLKKKGAWFWLSPAPMLVTTLMRLTPRAFIERITLDVPSVSMVSPTSEVRPPSAITHPVTGSSASSKSASTSAALVTSPLHTRSMGEESGEPAAAPPLPGGTHSLEGSRHSTLTRCPRSRA
mmetsp:Transcript_5377/g.18203  ORF Transcript_5377/g.18203 Transcript_5377/m.18203 type:complete len:206 (-) Transcript_5377:185-802(-)